MFVGVAWEIFLNDPSFILSPEVLLRSSLVIRSLGVPGGVLGVQNLSAGPMDLDF